MPSPTTTTTSETPMQPTPCDGSRHRRRLALRLGPLPAPVRRVLSNALLDGLATPHGVSRYLETLHPLWSLEGGRALVTDKRRESTDMVTLTLRPDHGWSGFRAGQHIRLGVEIDGALRTRTYSVSCSQHRADREFTITVKRKEDGLVSGHLTTKVDPGEAVRCSPATGDVVLPDPRPARLLLISAGSGITPLASMLRTLADEHHTGRVTFLHYARTREHVPFAADLARIAAELPDTDVVIVPTSRGDADGLSGRFHAGHLEGLVADHLDTTTFACGPTGLVDAVEAHYETADAGDRLHVERFTPPALRANTTPGDGMVRFEASDLEVTDDGRPLIDQAEQVGLTPEFGCRMGICKTCTRRKVAGGVIDLRNGRRSDAPEEPIELCVSVAAGDVIIDL